MTTITICQRKGGNGKSTSALNLAHAFARRGLRVLVIDLDDQKNTTSAIAHGGREPVTVDLLVVNALFFAGILQFFSGVTTSSC